MKEEILQFNNLEFGEENIGSGHILHTQLDDEQSSNAAKELLNSTDLPSKTVFESSEDPQASLL